MIDYNSARQEHIEHYHYIEDILLDVDSYESLRKAHKALTRYIIVLTITRQATNNELKELTQLAFSNIQ